MYKIIAGIVALAVIIGGVAFAISRHNNNNDNQTPTTTQTQPTATETTPPPSQSTPKQTANVITYSDNGFSPSTLTVKAGEKVTLKNTSASMSVQFSSDPHPTHTDDPELNQQSLAPGQSQTFTVTTKGTHGYHNHIDPSQTGTLIVE